jgi:hypothetical protein
MRRPGSAADDRSLFPDRNNHGKKEVSMATGMSAKRWLPLWVVVICVAVIAGWFSFPPTRRLAEKFYGSLRVQRVQAVNVNLSSFVGPNANSTLQQMVSQMISDKVTVTENQPEQPAASAAAASQAAGFPVQLLGKRKDAPELAVNGKHAFDLTVDRARLQAIFKEAGRPDLELPQSIEGATVAVTIPPIVRARYGDCPGRPSATANIATPPPNSSQYSNCVLLSQGPSPEVKAPSSLDLGKLTEIGLELVGMTPGQAQQFLEKVSWRSMLGVPVPRFMRSYEAVTVNGVPGTLLSMAGRRGPTYTLIWARNGMVYSLTGYGDSGGAVSLADSLQ